MSSSVIPATTPVSWTKVPDGSAALPSFSFQNSQGTGIYRVSADVLGLSTAGVQRVVIDASGNVGVGTDTPTRKVHIRQDQAAYTWARIDNQSSSASAYSGLMLAGFGNTWGLAIGSTAANGNALSFLLDAGNSNSEKMRIDASGNLLVAGTTLSSLGTTNKGFFVRGDDTNDVYLQVASKGATTKTHAYFYNSSGLGGSIATNSGVISLANGSDYRIKNIIKPIENAVNTVNKLNCVVYEYKQTPGTYFDGFIAHELQEVIPTAVYGEKDAVDENGEIKIQGVDLARLVPVLTKAIQELSAKVDFQDREIRRLKGEAVEEPVAPAPVVEPTPAPVVEQSQPAPASEVQSAPQPEPEPEVQPEPTVQSEPVAPSEGV